MFLGPNLGSWSSKKQHTIARSSIEAKYWAIASSTAELNWITHLISKLQALVSPIPIIYCDNIGPTYVCANPIFYSRMKHIAIDFFFVHDQVAKG